MTTTKPTRRVLIVDDNRDGADALGLMVEAFGISTVSEKKSSSLLWLTRLILGKALMTKRIQWGRSAPAQAGGL